MSANVLADADVRSYVPKDIYKKCNLEKAILNNNFNSKITLLKVSLNLQKGHNLLFTLKIDLHAGGAAGKSDTLNRCLLYYYLVEINLFS